MFFEVAYYSTDSTKHNFHHPSLPKKRDDLIAFQAQDKGSYQLDRAVGKDDSNDDWAHARIVRERYTAVSSLQVQHGALRDGRCGDTSIARILLDPIARYKHALVSPGLS